MFSEEHADTYGWSFKKSMLPIVSAKKISHREGCGEQKVLAKRLVFLCCDMSQILQLLIQIFLWNCFLYTLVKASGMLPEAGDITSVSFLGRDHFKILNSTSGEVLS